MQSMKTRWLRGAIALAAGLFIGAALAVPVDIRYAAIVTGNGNATATDGVFPPGTVVSVQVRADSESLLTGLFLPASGLAETQGPPGLSLELERAGSGLLIAIPGATARVYSFVGDGPEFPADGDPPSADIWQWTAANLYLPLLGDLDSLLALTLDDVNGLIAAFGSMQLLTFTHQPFPNAFEFERASSFALYRFSIALAAVPEPPLMALVALAAALLAARRRA